MIDLLKQRGKVVALFVVCGTVVAFFNHEAAAAIFAALAAPVASMAAVEAWSAK